MEDKQLLGQIYSTMYRAMIAKDLVALSRLLDDSFVLVHMTGLRQSKRDYLQAIADGTLNYYSCHDTRLEITCSGDRACMTGCSRVEAAVFGGSRHVWPLKLKMALQRRAKQWTITEIRAETY